MPGSARLAGLDEATVSARRRGLGLHPVYKRIDTCAAEFASLTPYHVFLLRGRRVRRRPNARPTRASRDKVVILGGGPNRIGQGIEFDYCCVHAAYSLARGRHRDDHGQLQPRDRVDRLRHLRPALFRAADRRGRDRDRAGRAAARHACSASSCSSAARPRSSSPRRSNASEIPILGTSPDAIDLAEDRQRFQQLLPRLGLRQPDNGTAAFGRARPRRSRCGSAIRW